MMGKDLLHNVETDFPDYLRDESRKTGRAGSISFPVNEQEIQAVLAQARAGKLGVTVQGARTGITAGCVPYGGHILNLSRMNRITGMAHTGNRYTLSVQPGVLLADIRTALASREFRADGWSGESMKTLDRLQNDREHFFSPDPTE